MFSSTNDPRDFQNNIKSLLRHVKRICIQSGVTVYAAEGITIGTSYANKKQYSQFSPDNPTSWNWQEISNLWHSVYKKELYRAMYCLVCFTDEDVPSCIKSHEGTARTLALLYEKSLRTACESDKQLGPLMRKVDVGINNNNCSGGEAKVLSPSEGGPSGFVIYVGIPYNCPRNEKITQKRVNCKHKKNVSINGRCVKLYGGKECDSCQRQIKSYKLTQCQNCLLLRCDACSVGKDVSGVPVGSFNDQDALQYLKGED